MCDLRIDREGNWYFRGMMMLRRDIVRLLYRHLQRDGSGRFFVDDGRQRCEIDVEDTAYVVRTVHRSEAGFYLLLSDDSVEEMNAASLRIGAGNVPYCAVKGGCFDARFSSSSYYQLAEHIGHDPVLDRYFILLNGDRHNIDCVP